MQRLRNLIEGRYTNQRKSGYGIELFLPDSPQPFDKVVEMPSSDVLFDEVDDVTKALVNATKQALLVWGEPGSGKSHLRDDITMAKAVINNVPFMTLAFHINGGKANGPDNARAALAELNQEGGDQNLIVLDNVDYLGYRGHRTRTRAEAYANEMSTFVDDIIKDETCRVLGLAHDQSWRDGRWTWSDSNIDIPAQSALDSFDDEFEFKGELTPFGMREIIASRRLDPDFANQLAQDGLNTFFYAQHIDPELYRDNPIQAVKVIQNDREERKVSK